MTFKSLLIAQGFETLILRIEHPAATVLKAPSGWKCVSTSNASPTPGCLLPLL